MGEADHVPYHLEFNYRGRELRVRVSGEHRHLDALIETWRQIAAEVGRVQAQRLLIVSHLQGEAPTLWDIRTFLEAVRTLGLENCHTAVVVSDGFRAGPSERAEILAHEFGFRLRIFQDEREAGIWLLHRGSD